MKNKKSFAAMALQAMLYEVTTAPKPGLVDPYNQGAHRDMDVFTFMASSSALSGGFHKIESIAESFYGSPKDLLKKIRPIGREMEERMFKATRGVNTHKGMIFSLGLLVAASTVISRKEGYGVQDIRAYSMEMTEGLSRELSQVDSTGLLTAGEKNFKYYGMTGIRGEVEAGFPTVFNYGLDALRKSYYTLGCKNDLLLHILFHLMIGCEDSTIVSRHNPETLKEVQEIAKEFVEGGGMYNERAKEDLKTLDQTFTARHISPGGSADLLAVTVFFGLIENLIH